MAKVRLIRLQYFVWVVVPLALYGLYAVWGPPHLIWSYDWNAMGPDSAVDFSPRYYTRCTYIGPFGPITVHPRDGHCALLRFAKSGEFAS